MVFGTYFQQIVMVNGEHWELFTKDIPHTAPSPAGERVRSSGSITRLFQPHC